MNHPTPSQATKTSKPQPPLARRRLSTSVFAAVAAVGVSTLLLSSVMIGMTASPDDAPVSTAAGAPLVRG